MAEEEEILPVFNSRRETEAFYNKLSGWYDLLTTSHELPLALEALEMLNVQRGNAFLEVGCGTGRILEVASEKVTKEGVVYGLDLAEGMLDVAEKNLRKGGIAALRVTSDALRIEECSSILSDQLSCTVAVESEARTESPNLEAPQELKGSDNVAGSGGASVMLVAGPARNSLEKFPSEFFDCVFISFVFDLLELNEIDALLLDLSRVMKRTGKLAAVSLSKEEQTFMTSVFEFIHKHLPSVMDCRPIFLARTLERNHWRIQQSMLKKLSGTPVELVVATPPT